MRSTRLRRFMAVAAAATVFGALVPAGPASAAPNVAGEYVALGAPTRILDTRVALGVPGTTPVGPGGEVNLQVTGVRGIPSSGVESVVMNVTADAPTEAGFVAVWPTGSRPANMVSNLNFVAGQTMPNLVTVRVGDGGRVTLYNNSGSTHLIADVVGFYDDATISGGWYNPVSPTRILDTREANGVPGAAPVGQGSHITVPVSGRGGVPAASQVSAVVLNVTVVDPTGRGFITVWPGPGGNVPAPEASTLNFVPGQNKANLTIVALGNDGTVNLLNSNGASHLVADVVGWFDRSGTSGLVFRSVTPVRAVDTREGGDVPVGEDQGPHSSPVDGAGLGGLGIRAVVMNVTATETTADSFFTIYRTDLAEPGVIPPRAAPVPVVSNLNWRAGETVPNLVMTEVSVTPNPFNVAPGLATVYNKNGQAHLIEDVVGYFIVRPT